MPCSSGALIAAFAAANTAGGGTINLTSGCIYKLTSADNGENGLPVVTTSIGVNGNGATIAGNNTSFRILEVSAPDRRPDPAHHEVARTKPASRKTPGQARKLRQNWPPLRATG